MQDINKMDNILNSLRSEFIIIGLTGALGSGCTESAKFLSKNVDKPEINSILDSIQRCDSDLEYRKLQRIKYFYEENEWENFFHIRVSDLLFLIFINGVDKIDDYHSIFKNEEHLVEKIENIKGLAKNFIDSILNINDDKFDIIKILTETNKFINGYVNKSDNSYTELFQKIGQNIRNSGYVLNNQSNLINILKLDNLNNMCIFIIPEIIRLVIKLIRKENKKRNKKDFFVIDAFRNIYEIEFFRNRYQSFYLFSIMSSEEKRKNRILSSFNLTLDKYNEIKEFETNDKDIESQAINACISKGDIFINNDIADNKINLYLQLIKYISLIKKPGLFTPNDDERFMQVAFTARYNSGCISRQVGAVVTGEDGYLRGFGWNDTPESHISCLYRTPEQLINSNGNSIFSEYERSSKFTKQIVETFSGQKIRFYPFCFKDQQAEIELKNQAKKISYEIDGIKLEAKHIKNILEKAKFKNPTRERALHAEENAFLQISKSGGETVINGTLYTTDSPCQLCAKKTMQLKIKRVVYIDAYPDISIEHTLKAGESSKWPKFDMFSGAIGAAYFKLFVPLIGRKDEIKSKYK